MLHDPSSLNPTAEPLTMPDEFAERILKMKLYASGAATETLTKSKPLQTPIASIASIVSIASLRLTQRLKNNRS